MSSTRPSLVRLFKIHQAIAEKKYPSADDLAALCEVNARTIKRDVSMLRDDFGAPVIYSRRQQGYYYTREFTLTNLPLSEGELLALCMTRAMTEMFRNTHFAPAIQRALLKLQVLLPETAQLALADTSTPITYLHDPAPPESVETCIHFNDLLRAVDEHRQARITYYSLARDAIATRVIDPYQLFYRSGMWYLYAWCHLRHDMRDFALGRIREVQLLSTTFTPPDPAAIRDKLAQRFSLIEDAPFDAAIWFDIATARRIRERVWHPTQRIEEQPDGSLVLYFTAEGLHSVTRWVLGFGGHAKPLAPPELVKRVLRDARAIVKLLE